MHNCKEIAHHSKMGKKKGSGTNLYGVQSLDWADDWCVLCEGEIDALTYQQIGVPAVAVPGAEVWRPYWDNIFEDFSRVYLAMDGDDAAKDLWNNSTENLTNIIKMQMPDGEDVNSMYLKAGKDYLLGRIKK
jgi:DNA primase